MSTESTDALLKRMRNPVALTVHSNLGPTKASAIWLDEDGLHFTAPPGSHFDGEHVAEADFGLVGKAALMINVHQAVSTSRISLPEGQLFLANWRLARDEDESVMTRWLHALAPRLRNDPTIGIGSISRVHAHVATADARVRASSRKAEFKSATQHSDASDAPSRWWQSVVSTVNEVFGSSVNDGRGTRRGEMSAVLKGRERQPRNLGPGKPAIKPSTDVGAGHAQGLIRPTLGEGRPPTLFVRPLNNADLARALTLGTKAARLVVAPTPGLYAGERVNVALQLPRGSYLQLEGRVAHGRPGTLTLVFRDLAPDTQRTLTGITRSAG